MSTCFCFFCRLNEGFTVFLERKILGRTKGEKMVDFAYIGKAKQTHLLCNLDLMGRFHFFFFLPNKCHYSQLPITRTSKGN